MKRKQFTFYQSFYDVIHCIKSQTQRGIAYDTLCRYAIYGEMPELDKLSPEVKMMMLVVKPVLDAARRKAAGASKNGKQKTQEALEAAGSCEDTAKIWEGCWEQE